MIHEEKKVAKIVEELTIYFFAIGADKIQSGIEKEGKNVIITFRANYQPGHKNKLHELNEYLNFPKNDGIEDVYWELAGCGDPGETSQLLLVGIMIDKAEIQLEEEYVFIRLYKELLE